MDFKEEVQLLYGWMAQVGNLVVQLLWHLLHVMVSLWYFVQGVSDLLESYFISKGVLKRYKSLHIGKLRYLAIVIESEDAHQTSKIIELLEWLVSIGVKHVCLYDAEGILKKSKESILVKLDHATLLEESHEDDVLLNQKDFTLEFVSFTDGKEAVAKAANVLFMKYLKLSASGRTQEDQIFTEPNMTEALKAVGCIGLEPDLLLVYGPARCHLGFPAWRIRYTEIVHMGPLKSMRYGSLKKAIHKFTMVHQNYVNRQLTHEEFLVSHQSQRFCFPCHIRSNLMLHERLEVSQATSEVSGYPWRETSEMVYVCNEDKKICLLDMS
ncbi:hypothetical protein SLA2020_256020 [Shorea laevis]